MEVTLGKEGLKNTWQAEFPEEIKCYKCKGMARIIFVAHEGMTDVEGTFESVSDLHPNKGEGGYWFHDFCTVAVYLCKDCFQPIAICNQA